MTWEGGLLVRLRNRLQTGTCDRTLCDVPMGGVKYEGAGLTKSAVQAL